VKYKLVIFDFDGTLADSFPWFVSIANSVADAYNFKRIEEHEIETLRGFGAREVVQHLGVPWWKIPFIGRHVHRLAADQIDQITLFQGVEQLLHQLADAGVTLALATSNTYDNARRVLGPENSARITHYECGTSIFGKRARFERILKRAGVRPQAALCIGDEIRDLEAAASAGIPFGAVAWGFTHVEALQTLAPAEVFMHISEIADAILPPRGR
jgi:phosphoglycolate phosphatase